MARVDFTRNVKNVRAYNVHVGDELSFYDSNRHCEQRMTVRSVERRDYGLMLDAVVLTVVKSDAKRKARYVLPLRRMQVVRVSRLARVK